MISVRSSCPVSALCGGDYAVATRSAFPASAVSERMEYQTGPQTLGVLPRRATLRARPGASWQLRDTRDSRRRYDGWQRRAAAETGAAGAMQSVLGVFGVDQEFAALLALPALLAVGLAYWLAEREEPIRAGDMAVDPKLNRRMGGAASTADALTKEGEEEATEAGAESAEGGSERVAVKLMLGLVGEQESQRVYVTRAGSGEGGEGGEGAAEGAKVVVVGMERPVGIVFEEVPATRCIRIAAIIDGTNAARRERLAQMTQTLDTAARVGDILLGFTTVATVYGSAALAGTSLPKREVQFVPIDRNSKWERVTELMLRGRNTDGPAQFVLQRPSPSTTPPASRPWRGRKD